MQKITLATLLSLMLVADLCVVQGQEQHLGRSIGAFTPSQGSIAAGNVYAASTDTILIDGFTFNPLTVDAFFFIGNQIGSGSIITTEDGSATPLGSYNNERVVLRIPNQVITNFQVLYIWIPTTQVNLGVVSIPSDLVLPSEVSLGELGLTPVLHEVHADDVIILNAKQLRLLRFTYDNTAPDVYFWVGTGTPSRNGQRVPDENGVVDEPLSRYDGEDITITLPGNVTVCDMDYLSIWCESFAVNFGHVIIPMNLDPQSLPAVLDVGQTKVFENCQVLEEDKFHVAWTVDRQRDVICIQLRGKVDLNEYMAFGISGSPTGTLMRGSDVTVGWIDAGTMQANAVDYFLDDYTACSSVVGIVFGACPDDRFGYPDDVTLIDSYVRDGVTFITYEKPLTAAVDMIQSDQSIPLDRPVFISWAYGQISAEGLVTRHERRTPGNLQINFGLASSSCPDFTPEMDDEPVVPWVIPPIVSLTSNTFTVFIGPSGGRRGVQGITGVVGWGVAWYINSALIPEITVSRGVNYVFVVNGGNDPATPALNHPFYITSSERGGYSQLTEAQRQMEVIYAGPAAGPLCQWRTMEDPLDHLSFSTYQATFSLECVPSVEPSGILQWTPDNNTPDLVYYQCYTHQYLGWKINVVGQAPSQPCDSQPCQNGGTCTNSGTTGYFCNCVGTGFTGIQCQTALQFLPCDILPCQNGGTCTNVGTMFQCDCPAGFSGPTCSTIQSLPCDTQPCQNGGTCTNVGTMFQCDCPAEFTGTTCSVPQSFFCFLEPCQNGGTCVDTGSSFQCVCASGFSGTNCEIFTSLPCASNPCINGGTCQNTGANTGFMCSCNPPFTGTTCQRIVFACESAPCMNGGVCQNTNNGLGFSCSCPLSFTGPTCQEPACDPDPCLNGATCFVLSNGQRFCQCADGFTGTTCATVVGPCGSRPCLNGGTCLTDPTAPGGFTCDCTNTGFSGTTCQEGPPCNSNPCMNGGACQNTGANTGFMCNCSPPFTGITCQRVMLPCESAPCINGGSCQSSNDGGFTCVCPFSFTGPRCEEPACNPNPCSNGATCFVFPNIGFFCDCADGFTGETCDIVVGPCNNSPCLNGGTCLTDPTAPGGFRCDCMNTGFSGVTCQTGPPCNSNPCVNGGTCQNTDGNTGFMCSCNRPFTGNTCQRIMLACESAPCMNGGVCRDMNNGLDFACACPSSFTGLTCQEPACVPDPCLNGATCFILPNSDVFCQCADGFIGENCETGVGPCGLRPCLNGGTCRTDLTAPGGFTCDCTNTGFFGTTCQTADFCFASPCENGGICQQAQNRITCDCSGTGFTGPLCTQPFIGDTTPPTVSNCPSEPVRRTAPAGTSEVAVSWTIPRAIDASGAVSTEENFEPGSLFPVGTTSVQYVFTDVAGNSAVCTFDVIVTGTSVFGCNPNPCRNGATCFSFPNIPFFCQCVDGFTGEICDTSVGPCGSRPCLNGGSCLTDPTAPGGFRCDCTNTGYLGTTCQIADLCFTNPCENGGICQQTQSRITCDCSGTGFTGPICTQPDDTIPPTISNCPSEPVRRTAPAGTSEVAVSWTIPRATDASGAVSTEQNFVPGSLFPVGTTSVQYVFTDVAGNSAVCTFDVIVTGTSVFGCNPNPCRNGATCFSFPNIPFFCQCVDGFTGEICDTSVGPCGSRPCLNGGSCLTDPTAPGGFTCDCTNTGYLGTTCQIADLCFTNPCENGGICQQVQSRITCDCSGTGFTGPVCRQPDDTTPPTISNCPSEPVRRTAPAGTSEVAVSWTIPRATDASGMVSTEQNFVPGSLFPVGTTSVHYVFTDVAGNSAFCTFDVIVTGTSIPDAFTVTCPEDICMVPPAGMLFVQVTWSDPVVSGGVGQVNQLRGPAINSAFFQVGSGGAIIYQFSDSANNFAECDFRITVMAECPQPTTPLMVENCPSDTSLMLNVGSTSAFFDWDDLVVTGDGTVRQIAGPPSSSGTFLPGETRVEYIFQDDFGQTASCLFMVMVTQDSGSFFISCPSDIVVTVLRGAGGGIVSWDVPVIRDNSFILLNSPRPPGSFFLIGTSPISYPYLGPAGQFEQCAFSVTVNEASPCDTPSCQNGGTCIPLTLTDFTCACPGCFRGDRCEDVANACAGNQCQNGGTCQPFIGSCEQYFCLCPPCFSGILCELQTNPCDNSNCDNGAVCSPSGTGCSQFTCQCQGCFSGPFCDQEFNPCSTNPCQNGGICQPVQGSCTLYTCNCVGCFTGFNCEIPFNPCQNQPCLNGGTCRSDPTSCTGYSCDCVQCFVGFQCELAIANPCDGSPCLNGGTCIRTGGSCTSFFCLCQGGFGGPLCQTVSQVVTNPCSSVPCQNGGSCVLTDNGYHCICRVGYRGNDCEVIIDNTFFQTSCFNGLCQNGGTCYDSYTSTQPSGISFQYTCLCAPGFTGQACSLQTVQAVTLDACGAQDPDYCSNNGICLNAFVSISQSILPVCDCPPGFAGQSCGVNVGNPCTPNPCRNNGQCVDFGQYFICNCVQPFAGETCESLQVDRNPPEIMNCPTQTIIVRTTETHAIVNWPEPTAIDDSQFPVRLTSVNSVPGALHPVGTFLMVSYTFEDVAGNSASCSFFIQVLSGN